MIFLIDWSAGADNAEIYSSLCSVVVMSLVWSHVVDREHVSFNADPATESLAADRAHRIFTFQVTLSNVPGDIAAIFPNFQTKRTFKTTLNFQRSNFLILICRCNIVGIGGRIVRIILRKRV